MLPFLSVQLMAFLTTSVFMEVPQSGSKVRIKIHSRMGKQTHEGVIISPAGNGLITIKLQNGYNLSHPLDGIDSIALGSLEYIMPELPYSVLNKDYIRLVNMPSDNPGTFNNANPSEYLFDDIADWNNGKWKLEVANGEAVAQSTKESPDLKLGIKALGSLFTGMRRARELAAWGLIEGDARTISTSDNLFVTRHAPHCPDHY